MSMESADRAATMRAITVSREYGSGGGEIAARLARRLGWQLIDHGIVAQVARMLNEPVNETEAFDEHAEGFLAKLGASLRLLGSFTGAPPDEEQRLRRREALKAAVVDAVSAEPVVIVGRSAQVVLADRRDALHLRVVAPLESRIAYVARREGLDPDAAKARIQQKDHDREHYLIEVERRRADDASLYDLVINTGVLSLDNAVQLTLSALQFKGERRGLPAAELGPGAGLEPYPTPVADFPSSPA
jgi:cytidylate kinase